MLASLRRILDRLSPSRSAIRVSRVLRGPGFEPIGTIDHVEVTPAGIEVTGTITPGPIADLIASPPLAVSIARDDRYSHWSGRPDVVDDWELESWQRSFLNAHLVDGTAAIAFVEENRRARIRVELQDAGPRPDLERARALADNSQTARPGHDEYEFAWATFTAAGGHALSPWRAFQAGLRAQVDRIES